MPEFDVITINQTHLAKVMVARQTLPEPKQVNETIDVTGFQRWKNYIRKTLKNSQTLSTSYKHILN